MYSWAQKVKREELISCWNQQSLHNKQFNPRTNCQISQQGFEFPPQCWYEILSMDSKEGKKHEIVPAFSREQEKLGLWKWSNFVVIWRIFLTSNLHWIKSSIKFFIFHSCQFYVKKRDYNGTKFLQKFGLISPYIDRAGPEDSKTAPTFEIWGPCHGEKCLWSWIKNMYFPGFFSPNFRNILKAFFDHFQTLKVIFELIFGFADV